MMTEEVLSKVVPLPLLADEDRPGHLAKQSLPNLAAVAAFPAEACQLGLIPALEGALKELHVPDDDARPLADEITDRIHAALAAEYRVHCKEIAKERNQPALYRTHVLGIPPPSAPT